MAITLPKRRPSARGFVRSQSVGRNRRRKLSLESLESRRLLAVFIVDTFVDSATGICGPDGVGNSGCSLRSAIIAANSSPGADSITLPAGTYELSIAPLPQGSAADGDLDITEDLTITGSPAGPSQTVIDANQIDRVFDIFQLGIGDTPLMVNFSGLTIQGGLSPQGSPGGGIDASSNTTLSLSDSIVQNNRVDTSVDDFGDADGGGIATSGNLILTNTTITNNFAESFGGGIAVFDDGSITITDSTISANTAEDQGGGIWAGNRADYQISVTRTDFIGNVATDEGGGLFVEGAGSAGSVSLDQVTFRSNQAGLGGGGAYVEQVSTLTQTGGTYDLNVSGDAGGGLLVFDNGSVVVDGTTFTSNTAVNGGGGAALYTAATFRNALFDLNTVTGSPIPGVVRFDLGGGGIAVAQQSSVRPLIRIEDSSILNNTAALAAGIGAANSFVEIVNSSIEGNHAMGDVGGGGGIGFAQDDVLGVTSDRVRLTIQNSTIANNTSDSEAGGIGIADADAEITDSTVTENNASGGRAGGIGMIGFFNAPTLQLDRTTIDNNSANSDGGGIAVQDAGFFFNNTTISNNDAAGNGGGLAYANSDPTLGGTIEFSTIATNQTNGGFGSNVAVDGSVTTFLSSIVADPQGSQPIINIVAGGPGQVTSQGFNLFADSNFSNPMPSDLLGVDPLLGPLADNGGAVATRALLPASPAIDAGADTPLAVDARGSARPVDGNGDSVAVNDIGAFEAALLSLDFGDAPDSYSSLLSSGGPRHSIDSNFTLGPSVTSEPDALLPDGDTDDGVSLISPAVPGETASLSIDINSDSRAFYLDAWFDWNRDGVFDLTEVLRFRSANAAGNGLAVLSGGINVVSVGVPAGAATGQTFARVRLSEVSGLGPTGEASSGEVEDIAFLISPPDFITPQDDPVSVNEDTPISIPVLDNDSASSGSLRLIAVSTPSNGTATIVGDQILYTPDPDFFGSDEFTYDVTNAPVGDTGLTASATVVVSVVAVNDPPIAADDVITAPSAGNFVIPFSILLANDVAGPANELQALSITAVTQPADGTVVLDSSDIIFTPPAGFSGTTSFSYTITDDEGLQSTAVVTVNVASAGGLIPVNDRISGSVGEVVQFDVSDLLSNDFLDGASGSPGIELVDPFGFPVGTTTIQTDGGGNLTLNGSGLTYTPPDRFFGNDKFRYRISDVNGVSDTFATVTIDVVSAAALAAELLGDSRITISNARIVGGDGGHGFFVDGAAEGLPIDSGIILSTGFVGRALGPNQGFESFPEVLDAPGDADLAALLATPGGSPPNTFDASILEFDFTVPIASRISFEYIFASNEYNEFVDDIFNDVLAFFLDDQNIATVPGTSTPVAINNINLLRNSQFFNDNENFNQFQTSFDGFTTVLEAASGVLVPGQTYHLKLAITDVEDAVVDSAVLLRAKSFGIGEADLSISATQDPASAPLAGNITYSFDVVNNGPSVSTNTMFASALPLGATLVSATSTSGTVTSTDGGVTVDLGDMPVGQPVTIQIVVSAPNIDTELTTQASISASQLDPVFSNNSVNLTTIVGDGRGGLLVGQISCDANGNGELDPNEGVPLVTVFIDQNGNRLLDSGESSATTDSLGNYQFTALDVAAGESVNVVVQNPPSCFAVAPEIGVTRTMMTTGALSRAIVAADHNGDGHQDLLVVNELGNDVSVLLNNGFSSGFSPGQSILVGKRPVAIASWQPQGSSVPVIAVAAVGTTANKGSLYVIENGQVTRELSAGDGPIAVAINDFNRDGQADFVAATLRSGTVVAQMSGEGGERVLATTGIPISIAVANLNDDSFLDLVVVSYAFEGDNSSEVIALLGNGQGGFTPIRQSISGREVVDVAVANFDADSTDELAIASYSGLVRIFDFNGNGFSEIDSVTTETTGVQSIAAADVNRDGRADLVIANSKAETIELFINEASEFVRNSTITGVPSPSDIVIANLDGDQILDIAVSNLYGAVNPDFKLPSAATILGLTVAEREIQLTAAQDVQNFGFNSTPLTPLSAAALSERSFDVDRSGTISPRDALVVINAVSRKSRAEGEASADKSPYKLDVNRDGQVTALDALLVINHMSRARRAALTPGRLLAAPADPEHLRRQQAVDALMSDGRDLF